MINDSLDPRDHLTPQEVRCVEAYAKYSNQTRAAKEAGYAGNAARLSAVGGRIVRSEWGGKYLKILERMTRDKDGTLATVEERRSWLTTRIVDEDLPMKDRLRAMDMLCKTCGDYVETRREEGTVEHIIRVVRTEGAIGSLTVHAERVEDPPALIEEISR
jgi:hypothetical protein